MPRAGQTKPAVTPRLPDRIAIGVLTRTFPPELVDRVIARTGRAEQRQRLLPARVVVYYTLAMCLFAHVGYEEVMRLLVEGLAWARRWRGAWQVPDKARSLGPEPGWGRHRCGSCSRRSSDRWRPARRRGRGIAGGGWWRWTAPPWTCRTRPPTWRRSAGPVAAAGRGRSRRSAW
jgi:Insertion element 4 transposase N-terminal